MNDTSNVANQQGSYEYVEMQSTETYREDYNSTPVVARVLFTLVIPVVLLTLILVLLRQFMEPVVSLTTNNTKVIAENNELLRENISLQREILKAMRKSTDDV
ncbi:MAG: hypothetical protein AAGN15_16145 [Cyanobacteria bacterium J06581_3]